MKTETCKCYSGVLWIFLPNIIKIDPYHFQLYRFKVGPFLWDTVYIHIVLKSRYVGLHVLTGNSCQLVVFRCKISYVSVTFCYAKHNTVILCKLLKRLCKLTVDILNNMSYIVVALQSYWVDLSNSLRTLRWQLGDILRDSWVVMKMIIVNVNKLHCHYEF